MLGFVGWIGFIKKVSWDNVQSFWTFINSQMLRIWWSMNKLFTNIKSISIFILHLLGRNFLKCSIWLYKTNHNTLHSNFQPVVSSAQILLITALRGRWNLCLGHLYRKDLYHIERYYFVSYDSFDYKNHSNLMKFQFQFTF